MARSKLKEINRETIEAELLKMFGPPLEAPLEDYILDGYHYQVKNTSKGPVINTGAGGIRLLIQECRKLGVPDRILAKDILVFIEGEFRPLNILKVTKLNHELRDLEEPS